MDNITYTKKVIDNYHTSLINLTHAIQRAGGSVDVLDKKLTLNELLMMCSTNSVIINAQHIPSD